MKKTINPVKTTLVIVALAAINGQAQGAVITQTSTMGNGETWDTPTEWSNDQAPSGGNTYLNDAHAVTRTGSGTFAGESLELRFGGAILGLKSGAATVNLIMNASTQVAHFGGSDDLNGTLTTSNALGTGSITFFSANNGLDINLNSQMTIGAEITSIIVNMGATQDGNAALTVNNALNSFGGTWDITKGSLVGTAGLGSSSFNVQSDGLLDFGYDFSNAAGDLTMTSGSTLFLDQALTFGSSTIGGTSLTAGVYDATDLSALGITATGGGTLTVAVPEPSSSVLLLSLCTAGLLIRRRRA